MGDREHEEEGEKVKKKDWPRFYPSGSPVPQDLQARFKQEIAKLKKKGRV